MYAMEMIRWPRFSAALARAYIWSRAQRPILCAPLPRRACSSSPFASVRLRRLGFASEYDTFRHDDNIDIFAISRRVMGTLATPRKASGCIQYTKWANTTEDALAPSASAPIDDLIREISGTPIFSATQPLLIDRFLMRTYFLRRRRRWLRPESARFLGHAFAMHMRPHAQPRRLIEAPLHSIIMPDDMRIAEIHLLFLLALQCRWLQVLLLIGMEDAVYRDDSIIIL